MSDEQITDVQAEEQKENGQGEAPAAAAVQLDQQQQVAKEVQDNFSFILTIRKDENIWQ